jgi:hypothetical protein
MPAAARQLPHGSWIELSAILDFMLATLVGNGAGWSVAPAIKGQLAPLPAACEGTCRSACLLIGEDRKWPNQGQNDAFDPKPKSASRLDNL